MDGDSLPLFLVYVFFLLGGSYFAAAESAFSAMNKIRIKNLAEDGNPGAKKAMYISAHFDNALTALLIGTNVMHIGCASLSTLIGIKLWKDIYGEGTATTCATILTTVLVYFISELLPKCIAKANAERTACALAGSLRVIMTVLTPLVLFFSSISKLLVRLFPASEEPTYTEDELVKIIETGEEEGVLDEERSDLLQSAIEFSDTAVSEVMTVREDMESVDIRLPIDEVLKLVRKTRHSRLPLYDGTIDNIVGVLPIRTFLRRYIKKEHIDLRQIMYRPLPVSPDTPIKGLFDQMRSSKIYMAVVRDNDGKTLGIATIEDFVEELVGEIWDEDDVVDESFIKLGGYNYDVSAKLDVCETFARIGMPCDDPKIKVKTFATWMIENLGHLPEEEESFLYNGITVEASEIEDGKVCRVILSVNSDADATVPARQDSVSAQETKEVGK